MRADGAPLVDSVCGRYHGCWAGWCRLLLHPGGRGHVQDYDLLRAVPVHRMSSEFHRVERGGDLLNPSRLLPAERTRGDCRGMDPEEVRGCRDQG
jgi:hypothetical protein